MLLLAGWQSEVICEMYAKSVGVKIDSDDLKAWSSDPAGIQTVSVITNGLTETVTVREIASISNRKHRFLRVSATVD